MLNKIINSIMKNIRLLKFLVMHEKAYRKMIWYLLPTTASLFYVTWQIDLSKFSITGDLPFEVQIKIRIILTGIFCSISLMALFFSARPYFKKYNNIAALNKEDLEKFNRLYGK
ncbi:MAG TPA: hypothetical protein ENG83_12455 [Nitrospirae bacterium]|nr:hypothetical protein [Nitrospirota bacterium]HDZ00394.1 hypothetical protein [Nitrospirota bacterium]